MKSYVSVALLTFLACALTGCGTITAHFRDDPFAPPAPTFLDQQNKQCVNDLVEAYNRAPDKAEALHPPAAIQAPADGKPANTPPAACFSWATSGGYSKQQIRDVFADQSLAEIDTNYARFFKLHYEQRAAGDMIFDFLNLGAGFTGTIAGGKFDKTVTNALVTLFTGTKLAEESNFYNKQASLAIIAKMDALRAARRIAIEKNLDDPDSLSKYPLRSLMSDLNDYYRGGTVIEALSAINQDADTSKQTNEALLKDQRSTPVKDRKVIKPDVNGLGSK